jgi:predicted HicB family RNase H-like nuclease
MLSNFMRHKHYWAVVELDDSADQFHGRVIGIKDVVDFYGGTPEELCRESAASVEECVAWCSKADGEPRRPEDELPPDLAHLGPRS